MSTSSYVERSKRSQACWASSRPHTKLGLVTSYGSASSVRGILSLRHIDRPRAPLVLLEQGRRVGFLTAIRDPRTANAEVLGAVIILQH